VDTVGERQLKWETAIAVARLAFVLFLLASVVALSAWAFRARLEAFGHAFVDHFGLAGLVIGTAFADGLHAPIPPQFYLLTGIAGGYSHVLTIGAVLLGSEIGCFVAFRVGRVAARWRWIEERIRAPRVMLERFLAPGGKKSHLALAAATLLPISYCLLCVTAGAMRLSMREWLVLAVMRVPKLVVSYAVLV
jgi:uncharacterized membrane protein YdjX (TVP38/TMEM64 family)